MVRQATSTCVDAIVGQTTFWDQFNRGEVVGSSRTQRRKFMVCRAFFQPESVLNIGKAEVSNHFRKQRSNEQIPYPSVFARLSPENGRIHRT